MNAPDPFDQAVAALTRDGPHRVWSLIVTVFGDLAQGPGDELSGALLARILEPVGVRAEALRVALHRLRKDGWIESRREGRTSCYFLTTHGRSSSIAAAERIYAPQPACPGRWHVLIAGSAEAARALLTEDIFTGAAYLLIGDRVLFGPGPAPQGVEGALALSSATPPAPDWLKDQILPAEMVAEYARAHDALSVVLTMTEGLCATPLQAATLRVLIVHTWRRLVLRHADMPDVFLPEGARAPQCRAMVMDLLDRFARPALAGLGPEASAISAETA